MYEYILTFLTGMLGIWKAIPVGVAFQLHPAWTFLITSMGASLAVLILYFFGSRIRAWVYERRKMKKVSGKETRARKLFEKYGTAGLGFLGTLLMGPNMTLIIGLITTKDRQRLLLWTLAGIFVWTAVLTLVAVFSYDLFLGLVG